MLRLCAVRCCACVQVQAQPELMPFIAAALDPGQPASLHKVCIKVQNVNCLEQRLTLTALSSTAATAVNATTADTARCAFFVTVQKEVACSRLRVLHASAQLAVETLHCEQALSNLQKEAAAPTGSSSL
eukprot:8054-Heterococcus_DN1.PRE.3